MSLLSKASALVLFALAALPFAACGSVSSTPNAASCSSFCQEALHCSSSTTCTLADPAGAQDACVSTCEAGYAAITPAEAALVTACLSCTVQAAAGACGASTTTCDAQCKGSSVDAAGQEVGGRFRGGIRRLGREVHQRDERDRRRILLGRRRWDELHLVLLQRLVLHDPRRRRPVHRSEPRRVHLHGGEEQGQDRPGDGVHRRRVDGVQPFTRQP